MWGDKTLKKHMETHANMEKVTYASDYTVQHFKMCIVQLTIV